MRFPDRQPSNGSTCPISSRSRGSGISLILSVYKVEDERLKRDERAPWIKSCRQKDSGNLGSTGQILYWAVEDKATSGATRTGLVVLLASHSSRLVITCLYMTHYNRQTEFLEDRNACFDLPTLTPSVLLTSFLLTIMAMSWGIHILWSRARLVLEIQSHIYAAIWEDKFSNFFKA